MRTTTTAAMAARLAHRFGFRRIARRSRCASGNRDARRCRAFRRDARSDVAICHGPAGTPRLTAACWTRARAAALAGKRATSMSMPRRVTRARWHHIAKRGAVGGHIRGVLGIQRTRLGHDQQLGVHVRHRNALTDIGLDIRQR